MQFWIGMRKERFRIGSYLNPSGCEVYRVSGRQIDGAQVRRNFKSYEEALAYRGELEIAALNVVEAVKLKRTRLSDAELSEAEAAFQKLAGGGQTLTQAVEYFLRNWKPALIPKTVQAAYDEFLAEKKAQRLRQRSMEDLKHRVGRFVRLNGTRYLNEITAEEVKPFVALPGRSARTRNGNRRSLLNFFRWCMKLDYCVANPLMKIDPAKVDEIHPKILTLTEVKSLLQAAISYKSGLLVPYCALTLFGGLRPAETARITWDNIDLVGRLLTVQGSAAKLRKRRNVELPENLTSWLLPYVGAPIVGSTWLRDFDVVRNLAGFRGFQLPTSPLARR